MAKISAIRKTIMESNSRQDIVDEKVKKILEGIVNNASLRKCKSH